MKEVVPKKAVSPGVQKCLDELQECLDTVLLIEDEALIRELLQGMVPYLYFTLGQRLLSSAADKDKVTFKIPKFHM